MKYDPIVKGKCKPCPSCGCENIVWNDDHFECERCWLGRFAEFKLWSTERWNRFCKEFKKPHRTFHKQQEPAVHMHIPAEELCI